MYCFHPSLNSTKKNYRNSYFEDCSLEYAKKDCSASFTLNRSINTVTYHDTSVTVCLNSEWLAADGENNVI